MPELIELPPGEEVVWFCGVPFRSITLPKFRALLEGRKFPLETEEDHALEKEEKSRRAGDRKSDLRETTLDQS